jgi:hypothetical protein
MAGRMWRREKRLQPLSERKKSEGVSTERGAFRLLAVVRLEGAGAQNELTVACAIPRVRRYGHKGSSPRSCPDTVALPS